MGFSKGFQTVVLLVRNNILTVEGKGEIAASSYRQSSHPSFLAQELVVALAEKLYHS